MEFQDSTGLFDNPFHAGKWTGPDWRNGTNGSEIGRYAYLPSHEGYVESGNRRWDECAREHDVALMKAACIKDDRDRRLAREEADVDFATCLLTVRDRAPFKFSEIGEDSLGYELAIIFWIFRFNRYIPSAFDPSLCSLCPGGSGSR